MRVEVARPARLLSERDEAEQLVLLARARDGGDVCPAAEGAVGKPRDLAGLSDVLPLGVELAAGAEEVSGERVRPPAIGDPLLGRLRGEADCSMMTMVV